MLNTPLISVIIPVYNLEEGIAKTLNSVCQQSYSNLQIIIVNDGSKDKSLDVCSDFAAKDKRISVINKENGGLSLARETGIKEAKGDYIHHLDGGDYISLDAYDILVSELTANEFPDILFFGFYYTSTSKKEKSLSYPPYVKSAMDVARHIWTTQQYNAVWQYIHKRELVDNIIFDKRLSLGEDAFYTSQLLSYADRVSIIDNKLLYYVVDDGVSMTRSSYTERGVASLKLFPILIDNFYKDNVEYDTIKMELLALKLQTDATLIIGGYLKEMNRMSKDFALAFNEYPELKGMGAIKSVQKLVRLYRISRLLYLIQLKYYQAKGKVRK